MEPSRYQMEQVLLKIGYGFASSPYGSPDVCNPYYIREASLLEVAMLLAI